MESPKRAKVMEGLEILTKEEYAEWQALKKEKLDREKAAKEKAEQEEKLRLAREKRKAQFFGDDRDKLISQYDINYTGGNGADESYRMCYVYDGTYNISVYKQYEACHSDRDPFYITIEEIGGSKMRENIRIETGKTASDIYLELIGDVKNRDSLKDFTMELFYETMCRGDNPRWYY